MYTNMDLIELENKSDEELREELLKANEKYEYIQSLLKEDDCEGKSHNNINLNIIFIHIKNIEMYIRRIHNLLDEYEIDRVFIKKAVNRRKSRLNGFKKMSTRLLA